MRVAILGMGAIGHVVARALDGRAELVRVDRTRAPLRDREAPVDAAIVTTKTPGTAWAAEVAAKILAPKGVALTIQNGLGNYETLVEHVGRERAVGRVATVAGVRIGEDEAVKQWRAMAALTGANRSSMLQDVEAGRPTEIDAISGAVAREGERRGVPAPLNQAMTLLVASLA